MRKEKITEIMNNICSDYVYESADYMDNSDFQKKHSPFRWTAIAACFILAIIGVTFASRIHSDTITGIPSTTVSGSESKITSEGTVSDTSKVNYRINYINPDYSYYETMDELIANSDIVVEGKVTGLSFQLLDIQTGLPPEKNTEQTKTSIYTIYDIDVKTQYKGYGNNRLQVKLIGGREHDHIEEQVAVLGSTPDTVINVVAGSPIIKLNETYIFLLYQYKNTMPTIISPNQGVFGLNGEDCDFNSIFSANSIRAYFKNTVTEYGSELQNSMTDTTINLENLQEIVPNDEKSIYVTVYFNFNSDNAIKEINKFEKTLPEEEYQRLYRDTIESSIRQDVYSLASRLKIDHTNISNIGIYIPKFTVSVDKNTLRKLCECKDVEYISLSTDNVGKDFS